MAALVHLDTLPFRIEQKEWLKPALRRLEADGSLFVTGSTRLYQMDMPTDDIDFFHTQRLSNNFLLISPADWLSIQDATAHKVEKFGRFSSEASIEHYCAEVGVFGIRIKNSTELRVFHAHEWGPRMREVRQRMHNGEGIQPFLMGWEEDFQAPWDRFYGFPRPSRIDRFTRAIRNKLAIRTRLRQVIARQR